MSQAGRLARTIFNIYLHAWPLEYANGDEEVYRLLRGLGDEPRFSRLRQHRGGRASSAFAKPPSSQWQARYKPHAPATLSIVPRLFLDCSSIVPRLVPCFSHSFDGVGDTGEAAPACSPLSSPARILLDGPPVGRLGWRRTSPKVNYGRTVENPAVQRVGIA
jgi:hypothetical protein